MPNSAWIEANTLYKGRPFSFEGYPFQRQIVDDMHPNMSVVKPSQTGMALALDTPIMTTEGWKTMGSIQVGDYVFDENGKPTHVDYISPIYVHRECYAIQFDTDEVIVADADHRWYVECDKAFNDTGLCHQTGRIPRDSEFRTKGVVTTKMLAKNYHRKGRNLFAIPTTKPLEYPKGDQKLPVDPYVLGLWLGDGHAYSATITAHTEDYNFYAKEFGARGYITTPTHGYSFKVEVSGGTYRHRLHEYNPDTAKLFGRLNRLGVIKHKHIPEMYHRASKADRMDLLRGLMDSDGTITKQGRCAFSNTNPQLVEDTQRLLCSLGFKYNTRWRQPTQSKMAATGEVVHSRLECAEVSFMAYADMNPFHLPRKASRVKFEGRRTESFRRRIVKVSETPSVPVRCISVSSASHLYLAGRGMIPTHNTEVQIRKALAFLSRNRGVSAIFTMPNLEMYNKMSKTRIRPIVDECPIFNTELDARSIRSLPIIQIGRSWLYMTGATEGDATSIAADAVFNDEVDLTDKQILALFNSRLQNSNFKINQRFSTPTHPGFGIDLSYRSSDQHEFLCRCHRCNHHNIPDFTREFLHLPGLPDHVEKMEEVDVSLLELVDLDASFVKCEKCGAPLDLGNPELREWVPTYPSRTNSRGYRIRPFSTDRLPITYIFNQLQQYRERDYIRGWYNTVLGQAHSGDNARLSEDVISACFTSNPLGIEFGADTPVWLGMDMGLTCHYVLAIGNSIENLHVFEFGAVPASEAVAFARKVNESYNLVGGAVDRHPYTPTAEEIREVTEGKVIPVEYRGSSEIKYKESLDIAQVNRTDLLDSVVRLIRRGLIKFSGYGYQKQVIIEHLMDMAREEEPEKPATWIKLNGNDHYFHALAFLVAGLKVKDAYYLATVDDTRLVVDCGVVDLTTRTNTIYPERRNIPVLGLRR